MKISMENLYVDIGAYRVNQFRLLQDILKWQHSISTDTHKKYTLPATFFRELGYFSP